MTETTTVAIEPRPLESLSPNQYQEWRKTGVIPDETPKEKPAAKQSAEVTEADAEQVTDSGAEAKKTEKVKKGVGSQSYSELRRIAREQAAEIERLKASPREEIKAEPAAKTAKAEKKEARPRQTDLTEDGKAKYATWEDYEDALLSWNRKEALAEFESTQTKRQQEAEIQKTNRALETSWKERVDAAKEKYADMDDALDPKIGPGAEINSGSFIDAWILHSELGAELLHHFHVERKELKRIGALNQIGAARELAKLEAKLSDEPSAKTPPAEPEPKKTKVPPPTREVGGRGTTAVDEVQKAVADDDVGAYIRSMNRQVIAAKKR